MQTQTPPRFEFDVRAIYAVGQLPISYSKCCVLDLHHSPDVTYSVDNCVLATVQEFVDLLSP